MAKGDDALTQLSREDLIAVIRAASGNDDETLKKQAQFMAEANKKALRPENETHPGKSVYNPLGDVEFPRPPLKCQMFWVGYDIQPENLKREEIELLNLATPGTYHFHRTDGSPETMTVTGRSNPDGSLERLEFQFPCKGENKGNLPTLVAHLRECFGLGNTEDALAKALAEKAELERLLVQLTAPAA
jgi:hypothetical protein